MLARLFLLFTIVTLTELFLLIWLSQQVSWQFTVCLVLATGFVGASLARWQGLQTWSRIQREMAAGRPPGDALVDGLLILVAGTLLCTPGVLTDAFGFSLLIPPLRSVIKGYLKKRFASRFHVQSPTSSWTTGAAAGANYDYDEDQPLRRDQIIDSRIVDDDST